MVESAWNVASSPPRWGEALSEPSRNNSCNTSDGASGWLSWPRVSGTSQYPPPPPLKFGIGTCNRRKASSAEKADERVNEPPSLFGPPASKTTLMSAKFPRESGAAKSWGYSENPFSIEDIVKEINNEFKRLKGEPVHSFRRVPPELEAVRTAIHQNTKALIDEFDALKADIEARKETKGSALRQAQEEVAKSRAMCLKCRVENLENLCCEYGALALK